MKYCFIAFGELALDKTLDDNKIISEVGGVSAFNTLYNLAVFGEETYAIGGVGKDNNGERAIQSLTKSGVNIDYIETLNKPTNVFYIYKTNEALNSNEDFKISRKCPLTGESSIAWSDKLCTELPKEFEDRNIILIVSNFEKVTRKFIENAKKKSKNCIVSLDITNGKIFEKFSEEYIWDYLKEIDLLQCNENTFEAVCKKLNITSPQELFLKLNLDIFTLTKASKGAMFFYENEENKKVFLDKKTKVIAPIVDPTGAGDAFHSMLLLSYYRKICNNEKLTNTYFHKAFDVANALARKVVQIDGARGEPRELRKHMLEELKTRNIALEK